MLRADLLLQIKRVKIWDF